MFRKISSAAATAAGDAHSFSSLASPFTRPPRPTPLSSRSLLQMFRKISSAAANAHSSPSLASPFTRPPKPSPLNSRNARSLLQMFWKISSGPADAHSFSSPFTLPPKPTPLNSRNLTSPFTFPAETNSSCPSKWLYGPKIRPSRGRLQKFLQTDCTSADVSADEAFSFFLFMVPIGSRSALYLFNLLLRGFAENERYHDILWLYGKMDFARLIPDFVTLNILLKCLCLANRVCDGFVVMGRIFRMGYMPNSETLNALYEGLIIGDRVDDAVRMYWTMDEICDCFPDLTTGSILRRVLRSAGHLSDDPSDSLCKQGKKEDKATELSSDTDFPFCQPYPDNPMSEYVQAAAELKVTWVPRSEFRYWARRQRDQPNLEARREENTPTVDYEGISPP